MNVHELAQHIGAELLLPGRVQSVEIQRVYAGDRISDLLNHVSDNVLLVTNLSNTGLMRVIELMDVPAICLLNGVTPEESLVNAAREHGGALLVSPDGMFETCGRLYQVLLADG